MTNDQMQIVKKVAKPKGPIRTEAVVPVLIIFAVAYAYFYLFFDLHLRKSMEYLGYQVLGAQVDIGKLETSFWKASLRIQNIELTDAQAPSKNMIEVGDIRFAMEWDALLRAKVLVNEMAVEGIKIGTQRKHPGKVKPPEPKSNKPSAMGKEADKLKDKVTGQVQDQYKDNVFGDLAALMSGTSGQAQMGKIEGSLASKQKLQELEKAFQEKSKNWNERINSLPQPKEIQALSDRLNKVKTKDFKSPQELSDSINQFQEIMKEADQKYKNVQGTANELNSAVKLVDQEFKSLDALVKKDIQELESRFRIPKLDAAAISQSVFRQYMNPYLAKINHYKGMAEAYVPPNMLKKGTKEPEPEIQVQPRARGANYEFGRQNSYPTFWIKKISVSSQLGADPHSGNIAGKITDVTSNQVLTGRPTVATIKGDFPAQNVNGFGLKLSLDNTKAESNINFDLGVENYSVNGRSVVESPDVNLGFKKANAKINANGELLGLKALKAKFKNIVKEVNYDIQAKDTNVQQILTGIFAGIPTVSIDADISGDLPDFKLDISSNLGPEIAKGFEAQVKKKIDEAKAKIEAYINEQVGQQKAKLEGELAKVKTKIDGEVKKVQDQLNVQKAQAEAKATETKKRTEDQAKKQIQKEGQKAVDDLKKKFGL